ncbi:MAG: hypothetical protein Q4G59_08875 [Planctomycetia bacterium]|nr:hypothetical protein [Planctomycetia bacterium]
MSLPGYSGKHNDRTVAIRRMAGTVLLLLLFFSAIPAWGQSGPLSYSGTTMYTPAKRFGVVGYSSGEKTQVVPPPIDPLGESTLTTLRSSRIPLTSSTQIDGQTVSFVPTPTNEAGVYSFDTQGVPQYTPAEQDTASITADDRLGQFMLFPRPVRETLFQGAGVDLAYVPSRKEEQAGFYHTWASVTIGIPAPTTQTPLLISPMFAWDRMTLPDATNGLFNKDVNLYAPGVRMQYLIPVNDSFMFDFGMSMQWTSDFKYSGSSNFLPGGYGSVVLKMDDVTRLVAGAGYYDAGRYKIMPFGGLLWRASEQLYLEVVFPKPRISWKLPESMQCSKNSKSDDDSYWLYLTADYNAQRWSIHQDYNLYPEQLKAEYRLTSYDIRFLAGLEKKTKEEISWALEGGVVFDRHLDFSGRNNFSWYQEKFRPKPAGVVQMKFRY